MSQASIWNEGLKKSRQGLWGRVKTLFQKENPQKDILLDDIEEILIESDMGVDTAIEIIESFHADLPSKFESEDIRRILKEKIIDSIQIKHPEQIVQKTQPHVILVVGVNGTGKTTTIGKLAGKFKKEGKSVLLAAADTFRAAAGEQLEIWANRVGADLVKQPMGADPAAVAFDAINRGVSRKTDIVLIDTAGRLHTKVNLMEELKKIKRVLQKCMSDAPHEILLVLDATTGQNGIQQAKQFAEAVGVTGLVLTKLDGTARGGVVIGISKILNLPILWCGLGEKEEDLMPFDADAFVNGMLEEMAE